MCLQAIGCSLCDVFRCNCLAKTQPTRGYVTPAFSDRLLLLFSSCPTPSLQNFKIYASFYKYTLDFYCSFIFIFAKTCNSLACARLSLMNGTAAYMQLQVAGLEESECCVCLCMKPNSSSQYLALQVVGLAPFEKCINTRGRGTLSTQTGARGAGAVDRAALMLNSSEAIKKRKISNVMTPTHGAACARRILQVGGCVCAPLCLNLQRLPSCRNTSPISSDAVFQQLVVAEGWSLFALATVTSPQG